jgi:hypothetical protein
MVLDRAAKKLDRNLDIVKVLKGLKQVELLTRIVLSQPKRYLLAATKPAIVGTNPELEELSGSDGEDFNWIANSQDANLKSTIGLALKPDNDIDSRFKDCLAAPIGFDINSAPKVEFA